MRSDTCYNFDMSSPTTLLLPLILTKMLWLLPTWSSLWGKDFPGNVGLVSDMSLEYLMQSGQPIPCGIKKIKGDKG